MSDHKELSALISLLDEPDIKNYNNIRKSIFSFGKSSIPLLETTLENTFDDTVLKRIQNIIQEIRFEEICKRLDNWVNSSSHNLLDAFLLITKFQYPDIDDIKIKDQIAKIQRNIWLELNDSFTALEKIKVFNHILFEAYKFRVNINKIKFQNFSNLYWIVLGIHIFLRCCTSKPRFQKQLCRQQNFYLIL